jgi:hypothetical protein
MAHFLRFGRRVPVPSTLQISHELRGLSADENARRFCAAEDGLSNTATWEEIIDHRGRASVRLD